jgi:hypothetical protein
MDCSNPTMKKMLDAQLGEQAANHLGYSTVHKYFLEQFVL